MKPQILLWFLLVCGMSSPLCAQQNQKLDSILRHYSEKNAKLDSLVKVSEKKLNDTLKVEALGRLYNTFLYNSPSLAERFARKELVVSEKINYQTGLAWANYHLGAYFQNAGKNDSARYYLKKSSAIYKEAKKAFNYAGVINSIAFIDYSEGKYDEAIEKYDEILGIYKNTNMYEYAIAQGDRANIYISKGYYKIALQETLEALKVLDTVYKKPWRAADAHRQVGYIEFLRENYNNALGYFRKAAKVYKEQKDNVYLSKIHNDIGNAFFYLQKNDSAIYHLQTGLVLAKENGISETEGNALSILGKVFTKKEAYGKALAYLQESLKIHSTNNYAANIIATQNDIGHTYLQMHQPEKAIPFLTKSIQRATGEGPINDLKNAHKYRFEAYRELGQWRKAIEDQLSFQKLKDSIFNEKSAQQIEELRTIYETEKKEQQIAIQEQEITVLEQEASISNLQRILMGIGLLLSLIGFYAIRQKMKRNALEKEKIATELEFKKKELTTHALNIARKNEVLETVKQKAATLKLESNDAAYKDLIHTINFDQQDDRNWENFIQYFEQVHKNFSANIKQKYPEITSNELRLMALLKMNLSSKEIASILNISAEGIKKARYRLRKKLNLTTEDSLQGLVLSL